MATIGEGFAFYAWLRDRRAIYKWAASTHGWKCSQCRYAWQNGGR